MIEALETSHEPEDESLKENLETQKQRFTKGELLTFVRVRFPGNAKSFPFLLGNQLYQYGQKVLAMSDRGMTVGYINSFPYKKGFEEKMLPLRSIARVATEEDIKEQIDNFRKEKEAENLCLQIIEKYGLDMTLTHVEIIQFGKKAVFYFNAPSRVDFRDLVKDLVKDLKMRIELRQITVRDRAAALGSIGPCGLQTCCSTFLKKYGNITIKMAKNQNLALIPSKINGVCGQIKCCIKFEDDVYSEKRNLLPQEGKVVCLKNGDIGRVEKLDVLKEIFTLLTDQGKRKQYHSSMFHKKQRPPENYSFPKTFDHITSELTPIHFWEKEEPRIEVSISEEKVIVEEEFEKEENPSLSEEDQVIEETPKKKPFFKRDKSRKNKKRRNS